MGYDYGPLIAQSRLTHQQMLDAANAATRAKSAYPSLSPSDFLLPGDVLENYGPGATAAEISNWYLSNQQVVWQAPDGTQTTVLPVGDPAQGFVRTNLTCFTLPNNQQVTVASGQMADPFGVGVTAFIPSVAATVYKQSWFAQGGAAAGNRWTPGAPPHA